MGISQKKERNTLNIVDYISAFKNENIKEIQRLITKDNINNEIANGYKPILLAAQTGNAYVLEYLISLGANLKTTDVNGHGIFYFASKNKIHNNSDYLLAVIIINGLMMIKNNETEYSLAKQFNKLDLTPFSYYLNYLVATNDSKRKNMKQADTTAKKDLNVMIIKLENIFNKLGISLKTETDFVDALKKSGIIEFCYIKDFLSLVCLFENNKILNYLIECKKELIKNELSYNKIDKNSFLEKSNKMLEDYINERDFTGWTPLHQACELENESTTEILMKNGAKANILTPENDDVLFRAVCKENIKLLKILIDNGAIEQFNNDELKNLFKNLLTKNFLGSHGNNKKIATNIMNLLIDKKLFSRKIDKGENFFHFAIGGGGISPKLLNDFIGNDKKSLEEEDDLNCTPFNLAIVSDNKDLVDFLLSKEINIITSYSNSLVLNVSLRKCKNEDIKKKIIKKIFDEIMSFIDEHTSKDVYENMDNIFNDRFVLLINSMFFSVDYLLDKNKSTRTLPALLDKDTYRYYNTKFSEKYSDGIINLDLLDKIVKDMLNNNSNDISTIFNNHLDCLFNDIKKKLLDAIDNEDINKLKEIISKHDKVFEYLNNDEQSLLWYATKNGKENVALYLLSSFKLFNINEKDKQNDGDTLLMLACDNNLNELSKELIYKNADIYLKNNKDVDIFKKTCITDNVKILEYLRKDLPKVINNKYGANEENLLICAVSHSSNEVVKFLIANGFNNNGEDKKLDEKNKLGKSAIMYAYDIGNYDGINLLLNAGANPQKKYVKDNNLTEIEKWLNNRTNKLYKKSSTIHLLSNKIPKEKSNRTNDKDNSGQFFNKLN